MRKNNNLLCYKKVEIYDLQFKVHVCEGEVPRKLK